MKRQIRGAVVAISLAATLSIAVMASVFGTLKADVPFDFTVNGKQMPAGKYVIKSGSIGNTIAVHSADTSRAAVAQAATTDSRTGGEPRLVFRRYGSQYFLAKVVSDTQSIEFSRSKAERDVAKSSKLALNDVQPDTVTISANAGQ